jgi:DNA replication protein DnaC
MGKQTKPNIESLILRAGFKQDAAASDIDYQTAEDLDKTNFERLLSLNFISKKENLIITGPTGSATKRKIEWSICPK